MHFGRRSYGDVAPGLLIEVEFGALSFGFGVQTYYFVFFVFFHFFFAGEGGGGVVGELRGG